MRYFVQLSYNGKNYHGWQIQPNALAVQQVLNEVFSRFFRQQISLTGAGRTDTGVHASFFMAHFDIKNSIENPENAVFRLNGMLPRDIALQKIFPVSPDANSRFHALRRSYQYHIARQKDPFLSDFSHLFLRPLALEKMNQAAALLTQHSDFTSFAKLHGGSKTNLCKVVSAVWQEKNNQLIFSVKADRFLRNMVRALVGTLLEVGLEKLSVKGFEEVIMKHDRAAAGVSVPPQGLFLTHIEYDFEALKPPKQ